MGSLYWNLPGPERFVHSVGTSLTEHTAGLVLFPVGGDTDSFVRELAEIKIANGGGNVRILDVETLNGANQTPLEYLVNNLPNKRTAFQLPKIDHLLNDNPINEEVFILTAKQLEKVSFQEWVDFLVMYTRECRARESVSEWKVCLVSHGNLLDSANFDSSLPVHLWWGRIGEDDLLAYYGNALRGWTLHSLWARSTLLPAAGWDMSLLECLLSNQPEDLPSLCQVLSSYCQNRWPVGIPVSREELLATWIYSQKLPEGEISGPPSPMFKAWGEGLLEFSSGRGFQVHAGLLAYHGLEEQVELIVWRGQIREILPLLETARAGAVRYLSAMHSRYWESWLSQREKDDTLELVEICQALDGIQSQSREFREFRDFIHFLRKARNSLVHMEILDLGRLKKILNYYRRFQNSFFSSA